ncbi:Transcriptional regulator, LysR family [Marinobacterium lacunae]|uniref:Transcriptional regulator, LysR family n=1 Tax=Marinobacterium lacunae TaxID=1232683 RepID=A0A081G042_9GAMM|nr:LysR family transcriptional regulator [Marinobacterium lacunae]KEA64147.1 Transcriptional regulator, LysR family [Marinobacterium lacunae]
MRWNIDDVPIYLAIIDHKGVSAAAQVLGTSKSTVSKALSRLEEALGVRLIERNSRNLRITSEGEVFYRHASLIMEQVRETDAVMAGMTSEPRGKLVVALPMAFAREIVAPHLGHFHTLYPEVDVEIIITSRPVDIIRNQIDLAVVVGALNDSELVAKTLYESRLLWVTSPEYAARHDLGHSAEALLSHVHICEQRYGIPHFQIKLEGSKASLDLSKGVMHVNDPLSVREAVINGCGVTMLPGQYCKRNLADGSLVEVFQHISIETITAKLSAIYPGRRLLPSKTRAFLDFLSDICEQL